MNNHDNLPKEESDETTADAVKLGEKVYNAGGELLGEVRGIEEGGFFVTSREGVERLSIEHVRSGQSFGEAELMWRCNECGEMGEIEEGFPESCPNCGTEKENIMYWTED
ncbi:hypothetical protein QA600_20850 [Natronococcus sp. A-GB1]|jgi:rubrerythrin|uniref:DUF7130 family rubredoxin-like protein n=1 Tax=Natronococcus sp. A-GB1 TaxID=3037648 RepID=UPI00241CF4F2|nr:hypothetical protein [Natronococcus sp. A-GB1]MDG5761774.1 hypothetical protein [Natronococcus sp. A-GB1]